MQPKAFRHLRLLIVAVFLASCSSGLDAPLPGADAPSTPDASLSTMAVTPGTANLAVTSSSDDADQNNSAGNVALTNSSLTMGQLSGVARTNGIRFQNVAIPKGATITSAYLDLKASSSASAASTLTIKGEKTGNPVTFAATTNNLSSRPTTGAATPWTMSAWTSGTVYRSPNLVSVVQEIVGQSGWNSGNALALLITGTGTRNASAFNSGAANAPKLVVAYTYDNATVLNQAITAGSDDAEEPIGYAATIGGTVLKQGQFSGNKRVVGLRFAGLTIPTGATIESALIEFNGAAADSTTASFVVTGEASDSAATYANGYNQINTRAKTQASVTWAPAAWASGSLYRTSELKTILQQIVSRPGWVSGNAAAFIISSASSSTGLRQAKAFESGAATAPRLIVRYSTGTVQPPTNPCSALSGTLPSPWTGGDIGTVSAAGKSVAASGVYSACSYGAGLSSSSDAFHYVRQPLNGDGTFTARLSSLDAASASASAGIMIREGLTADSKYAALKVNGSQVSFSSRGQTVSGMAANGLFEGIFAEQSTLIRESESDASNLLDDAFQSITSEPQPDFENAFQNIFQDGQLSPLASQLTQPVWLRLTRQGTSLKSYKSTDGQTWTPVATATVPMVQQLYVGLWSTSQGNSSPATAKFDNSALGPVIVDPSDPPVAAFTATPSSGDAPLSVTFDASTSQRTQTYTWDFNAADGITAQASGVTATTTYATPGTYTVTLTVQGAAGQQAQATQQITVTQGGTYEPPDPNTEPVVAEPKLDIGVSSAGGEMVFDAYGSQGTGLTYAWSFGDGSSASGPYVIHSYAEPGAYTVSLTITNSVGRTNTVTKEVAVLPEIGDMLPQGGERRAVKYQGSSSLNVSFDAGNPVQGLRYVWDFGDGSSAVGSKTQHRYSKLGSYTYSLKVYDERTTGAANSIQALQTTEPVLSESSWVTVWAAPPKANFVMTNAGSGEKDGPFYGALPLTMTFNANNSEGSGLTYAWNFGDGATATGATTSHTYQAQGLHQVTLTVTDGNGFTDTYTKFVRTTPLVSSAMYTSTGVVYPDTTTPSAMSLEESITDPDPEMLSALQAGEIPVINEHFPYVVLINNTSGAQANNYLADHGGFSCPYRSDGAYDDYYTMTVNGTPIGYSNYLVGVDYWNPNNPIEGGLCTRAIILRRATTPLLQSRSDAEIRVATPLQDFRTQMDVLAGVRVPRVFVTVLPDAMIPGELAGPYVREYTITNGGKQELMMTVAIRESEAQTNAEFAVPVYGVDRNGALATTANGYFNATFEGLRTTCDDCVMVNGRSMVTVQVPIGSATNREVEFNLSRVRLSRDGTCTNDTTSPLRHYLSNCVTVTAEHGVPTNAPTMEPYAYTLPPAALLRTGAITLGASGSSRDQTWANFGNTTLEVAKFGLNFIPFLSDGADLLGQVYNTATGQGADPVISTLAAAGLVLDVTTGGAADITAPVKAVYKFSLRTAEGGLALVIKETVTTAITSGKNAAGIIDDLKNGFEFVGSIAKGGFGTIKKFDYVFDDVAEVACSITSATVRSETLLQISASPQCKKQFAEDLTKARKRMDSAGYAFDTRKIIEGVAELKDRGIGGYDVLLNQFAGVGNEGNLRGYEFQLEYALSQLNNQVVPVRWVEARRTPSNIYQAYLAAGFPEIPGTQDIKDLDIDALREVVSLPGNYLDSKRWVLDQNKVDSGLLTDAEEQLKRMKAWVALDPANRIARFVLKDYNSLTAKLWDDFNGGGVVLVNINGHLIPRP